MQDSGFDFMMAFMDFFFCSSFTLRVIFCSGLFKVIVVWYYRLFILRVCKLFDCCYLIYDANDVEMVFFFIEVRFDSGF